MEPLDQNINVYGRTGPFGDALYFGLRDFKRELLRRIAERDAWVRQAFDEEASGERLIDEIRRSHEQWAAERSRLVEESLASWPEGESKTSDLPKQRRDIIQNRLRQIEAYLEDVLRVVEEDGWTSLSPSERLQRTLGAVVWPYYFIAYRPAEVRGTPNRKVTWLPPIEYLEENRRGARSLHTLLYPSLDRAVKGESDPIRRQLAAWLQIGEQPLPLGDDAPAQPDSDRGDFRSRDIGHVQRIRDHDRQPTYEGDLLRSDARRDSRFADCVYANRSTFQIPIREREGQLSPSDGDLHGVLFLCSPLDLGRVFPEMMAPLDRGREWVSVCFEAWIGSHGRVVGKRLKSQYQDLVDDLIQEVHRKTRRRSEQRSRRQRAQAFNGIAHSLGNAIDTSPDPNLELEQWCMEAAKGVIGENWTPEFLGWSDARAKLERAFRDSRPTIQIQENDILRSAADSLRVDPRLLAILTELCRNRVQNARPAEETAPINVGLSERGGTTVEIEYHTPCYGKDLLTIAERLLNTDMSKWRGINFIVQFADSIAPGGSVARWRFFREDEDPSSLAPLELSRGRAGAGRLEAPLSLLDAFTDGREEAIYSTSMRMQFWASLPGAASL